MANFAWVSASTNRSGLTTILAMGLSAYLGCQTSPTSRDSSDVASTSARKIQSTELYRALSQADAERGFVGVNALMYGLELRTSNLEIAALWMHDHYKLIARKNPRIGRTYAEVLQLWASVLKDQAHDETGYQQLMDTGVIAFYSSQMIAWEDLARCAEQTDGLVYRQNWSPAESPGSIYLAYLRSLDGDKRRELIDNASMVAAQRDATEPDRGACGSGMEAMRKAQAAGKCRRISEDSPAHRRDLTPGTQLACDAAEFATLISDREWHPRREEVRRALRAQLLGSN